MKAVPVFLLVLLQPPTFAEPYLFINQQQGNTVKVFDSKSMKLERSIPVLSGPTGIAITEQGDWLAVSHPEQGIITLLDGKRLIPVEHVNVGGMPFGLAFAGNQLFYTDWNGHFVGVIDSGSGRLIKKVPVGRTPAGIRYVTCTSQILVANRDSDSLSVLDRESLRVVKTIPVGRAPFDLDHDGHYAYVVNSQENSLSIVDLARLLEVKRLPVGRMPYGVAVDRRRHRLFVSNQLENSVSVIDAVTHKLVRTMPVGEYPENIAVDESRRRVYVLNWFDGTVSVFNGSNEKEAVRAEVGEGSRAFGQFIVKKPVDCPD